MKFSTIIDKLHFLTRKEKIIGKPWKQQYSLNTNNIGNITDWTIIGKLPTAMNISQAIVINGKIYILGGHDGGYYISTVYSTKIRENGTLDNWSIENSLPDPVDRAQIVVAGKKIHLLGGFNIHGYTSKVYTCNINEDGTLSRWTMGHPLPEPLGQSESIIIGNRVYLLGGYNGKRWISTIYTTRLNNDGTLGNWSIAGLLPKPLGFSQVVATRNRIYMFGGYNISGYVSDIFTARIRFNGTIGKWSLDSTLPEPLSESQVAIVGDKVYLLGGRSTHKWSNIVYVFTINSNGKLSQWSTEPSLPEPLSLSQALVVGNNIYLLGGYNGENIVSTIYSASINEDNTLAS